MFTTIARQRLTIGAPLAPIDRHVLKLVQRAHAGSRQRRSPRSRSAPRLPRQLRLPASSAGHAPATAAFVRSYRAPRAARSRRTRLPPPSQRPRFSAGSNPGREHGSSAAPRSSQPPGSPSAFTIRAMSPPAASSERRSAERQERSPSTDRASPNQRTIPNKRLAPPDSKGLIASSCFRDPPGGLTVSGRNGDRATVQELTSLRRFRTA